MVAKSFQSLPQVGEPYEASKRMYVKVRNRSGNLKQVRWYTETEYAKMYPPQMKRIKSQREVLGFTKGYVTIFNGEAEDWFKKSIARYARWWGWYIISTEEIPKDLPDGVTPIQLPWTLVSDNDETLGKEEESKKNIEGLRRKWDSPIKER